MNSKGRLIQGQLFYTVAQVANMLGVSDRTIYTYRRAGKLKAIKVGRKWLFSEHTLQEFLQPVATEMPE